jgi:hypothetical protein
VKPEHVLIADVVAVLLAATLIGMAVRWRLSECSAFTLYLVAVLTSNRLVTWWPAQFFNWYFWVLKEVLLQALILGVAIDLAGVALRPFPNARKWTRGGLVTLAVAAGLVAAVTVSGDYFHALAVVIPRLSGAAALSFGVLAFVTMWSWLPVRPFHRMIIAGFFLHLTAYVLLLTLVKQVGWSAYPIVAALDPAAFGASVGLWALGAWRKTSEVDELEERVWWEIVSPDRGPYYANLQKELDSQIEALNFTLAQATAAEKSGDLALAEKLREAGKVYAASIAPAAGRARKGLDVRRRMLAALGRSR